MTQKEKALITIKSIIENMKHESKEGIRRHNENDLDFLLEKVNACLGLMKPEVLLSTEEKQKFDRTVEDLRKKGKII